MASALREVGQHVQEGLEKIRAKPWAEPLGKGLGIGAKIVTEMGNFLPGAGILGGAMAFGASLLNPEPTLADLQTELQEIKQEMNNSSQSQAVVRALQRQQKELEEKIEKPIGEIKSNFTEIKTDMKNIFKSIEEQNAVLSEDVSKLKDMISQTFLLVADVRYRDGIEKIDAAYEVFITESKDAQFDDFKQYVFELKTIATQNLAPKRILEYMKIIHSDGGGLPMCQYVMDYIIIVLSKYLQMMTAYNIFKEDAERVNSQFELFNEQYKSFADIFEKVTDVRYKPGDKLILEKPIAKVSPMSKVSKQKTSFPSNSELRSFLLNNDLIVLEETLKRKNITLEDVLEMDKDEMEEVGITSYKHRKLLWRAIQDHLAGESTTDGHEWSSSLADKVDGHSKSKEQAQYHAQGVLQWQNAQPRKREFMINCPGSYIAVDEKMIAVGTDDSRAVLLNAYTGATVWHMQCAKVSSNVQLTMSEEVVTTVTKTGTVTVWDRLTRELLYKESPHGNTSIIGVAAADNMTITGGTNGSLAIMSLAKTEPRVKMEYLSRSLVQTRIGHIDCDKEHLLVGTREYMMMFNITDRTRPRMINTVQTGHVAFCLLFYPFGASVSSGGLQVWDMERGVKVRHLHKELTIICMASFGNILAVSEYESPNIYMFDWSQLCVQDGPLWTRKIRNTSNNETIALNSSCLFAVAQVEDKCRISVWDFSKDTA